jgi:hypothetical protein
MKTKCKFTVLHGLDVQKERRTRNMKMEKLKGLIFGLAIVAVFIAGTGAFASQGRGGGHFVFNADGTVTIADSYYRNTTLVPTPVPGEIQRKAKIFAKDLEAIGLSAIDLPGATPMMPNVIEFVSLFDNTQYFFVDVLPDVADCGLKVILNLPVGANVDLAACTSGNHTFIKKTDWFSPQVSDDLRAWLLVHERLREVTGKNSSDTEANIMTVIQAGMLIEQIHSLEVAGNYQSLTVDQTQLLEQARLSVIRMRVHKLGTCNLAIAQSVSDCAGDVANYAISMNGGGIIPRDYSNNVPSNSYVGVGSLIYKTLLIGQNVRIVNSTFHCGGAILIEDGVEFQHTDVVSGGNGEITFQKGSFKNSGIGINNNNFISFVTGRANNASCELNVTQQTIATKFNLPDGCVF